MKLWQKVFLCTLALVTAAVNLIAFILLQENHQTLLNGEMSRALSQHRSLSASLSNEVIYTRLKNNKVLLEEQEAEDVAQARIRAQTGNGLGVALITSQGRIVINRNAAALNLYPEFPQAVLEKQQQGTKIFQEGDRVYLTVGTPIRLEGNFYALLTLQDISSVFALADQQSHFVQVMSLVFAGITSLLLLAISLGLLRPLRRVNLSLRVIAAGKYSKRLPETGSREFRELAFNINRMAASVEEHVESLRTAAEDRKRFIDNLAHEMKTPLTSILGFADLLRVKKEVSEAERREYAGVIVEETHRLQNLSGKLMELITAGSTRLEISNISVSALFQEIQTVFLPLLEKQQLSLHCILSSQGLSLQADPELLKSLLYNLLDNARKASSPGQEITLSCKKSPRGETIFTVLDFGVGMPEESIRKVTQPFYMVDKSRSRKAGGVGLGLSLCAEIVRCHRGMLDIRSQLGKGTCVTVIFPEKKEESL